MGKNYEIIDLDNGLRCVHIPTDGPVTYNGIVVGAGSSDDFPWLHGLAHFVEHTVFKGTAHRSSWHINNRMESVGGELNAYTTKEETLIYTNAPAGNTSRALELLSDLVCHSTFPPHELDKEKEVVVEEIKSYLDSPMDSVFDEFEDRLYKGSTLGHNILGTENDVRKMTTADTRGFVEHFYVPGNMVVYTMDNSSSAQYERLVSKYFSGLHFPTPPRKKDIVPVNPPFSEVIDRDGHQAHTLMGVRAVDRQDPKRFALFLLNNYLGGPGMNSRLNQVLREKRGLVYTVDSTIALYRMTGQIQIYFGAEKENVAKITRLVNQEIQKLAENTLPETTFEKIRRQYAGQLLVGSDNREMRAMTAGKSLLYYGEIHDAEYSARKIMETTPEEMRALAENLCNKETSILTII